jgi:hypothetical protein
MRFRGSHAVLLILAAGMALGGYAWWHAYHRGHRSLDQWGSRAAVLIRYAPVVELWELNPQSDQRDDVSDLVIEGQAYAVLSKVDISKVRGLVHARHALVEDASFIWDEEPEKRAGEWTIALHFVGPAGETTVAFNTVNGQLLELAAQHPPQLRLQPQLVNAYIEKSAQWTDKAAAAR